MKKILTVFGILLLILAIASASIVWFVVGLIGAFIGGIFFY